MARYNILGIVLSIFLATSILGSLAPINFTSTPNGFQSLIREANGLTIMDSGMMKTTAGTTSDTSDTVSAEVKQKSGVTLVSIRSEADKISSVELTVKEGTIEFVKAIGWEAKKINETTFQLTTNKNRMDFRFFPFVLILKASVMNPVIDFCAFRQANDKVGCFFLIERGPNYAKYQMGNKQKVEVGLPYWTKDPNTNQYVPILNSTQGSAQIIQSGRISGMFAQGQLDAKLFDGDNKEKRADERWVLVMGTKELETTVKDDNPVKVQNTVNITRSFTTKDNGDFKVKYIFREGLPVKHQAELKLTEGKYFLVQRWNLVADFVKLANYTKISASHCDPCVVTKRQPSWQVDGVLDPLAAVQFGRMVGNEEKEVITEYTAPLFALTQQMKVTKVGTSSEGTELMVDFMYGPFGGTERIDPDTCTTGCAFNEGGQLATTAATGDTCPTSWTTGSPTLVVLPGGTSAYGPLVGLSSSTVNTRCLRQFIEWKTNVIPDGSNITSVKIDFTISSTLTNMGSQNCDFYQLDTKPSGLDLGVVANVQNLYQDAGGVPRFLDSDKCRSAGAVSGGFPLSSAANIDLHNKLTADWFGVGIIITPAGDPTRDSQNHRFTIDPTKQTLLTVVYTPP